MCQYELILTLHTWVKLIYTCENYGTLEGYMEIKNISLHIFKCLLNSIKGAINGVND